MAVDAAYVHDLEMRAEAAEAQARLLRAKVEYLQASLEELRERCRTALGGEESK